MTRFVRDGVSVYGSAGVVNQRRPREEGTKHGRTMPTALPAPLRAPNNTRGIRGTARTHRVCCLRSSHRRRQRDSVGQAGSRGRNHSRTQPSPGVKPRARDPVVLSVVLSGVGVGSAGLLFSERSPWLGARPLPSTHERDHRGAAEPGPGARDPDPEIRNQRLEVKTQKLEIRVRTRTRTLQPYLYCFVRCARVQVGDWSRLRGAPRHEPDEIKPVNPDKPNRKQDREPERDPLAVKGVDRSPQEDETHHIIKHVRAALESLE